MRRILLLVIAAVCVAGSFVEQAYGKHVPSATIAARQKFFGSQNVNPKNSQVDPDKVIFSWITNASFAVAVKGHVALLDTYVTRLEVTPGRTPFVIQDCSI